MTSNAPKGGPGSTDAQGNQLAFNVFNEERLMRFLVLGSEGGTLYATEPELTEQNARCVQALIDNGQGEMVVQRILEVATKGRAVRMNALLLALAICCRCDDLKTKAAAYRAIQEVCNIPTHLFKFIDFHNKHGKTTGWGRSLRRAIAMWYNQFANNPKRLAMLITKYRQREGWSHRDLLRLSHLKPMNDVLGFILRYAVKGLPEALKYYVEDGKADCPSSPTLQEIITYLTAVDEVRGLETPRPPPRRRRGRWRDSSSEEEEEEMEEERGPAVVAVDIPNGEENGPRVEVMENGEVRVVANGEVNVEGMGAQVVAMDIAAGGENAQRQQRAARRAARRRARRLEEEREKRVEVSIHRCLELIQKFDLLREHLPTGMLNEKRVWESLLEKMPFIAMVRNLAKMTTLKLMDEMKSLVFIMNKLTNEDAIRNSKVHPYTLLLAWNTYNAGKGVKGKLKWEPYPQILDCLDKAFYTAFGNVPATNKRILICMDVSQSMSCGADPTRNGGLTPLVASAAMAMVTRAVESQAEFVAFSHTLTEMDIKKEWKLKQVLEYIKSIPMGPTDCSLPILWALEKKKEYDAFIVYTDCETWSSQMRPCDALVKYRQEMNLPTARLAVVAMTSGGFTLADPNDLYMLDLVGFDSDSPSILQEFISGSMVNE